MLRDLVATLLLGAQKAALHVVERRGQGKEPERRVKRGQAEERAQDQEATGAEPVAGGPGVGPVKHTTQGTRTVERRRCAGSGGRNAR